ncbi:AAA family ATPase [Aurantimonas sp. 22II-16-19i]|uniref:AAA family ATPase n=1 Tax=Aurantimonas sp. 22II-16-19i TaxID=1317114 RepID=UPI0009F7D508|nr:AAA family ATPase [Aurantimonas sp. 22II-16-19i]ORE90762.1 ATPase central domain-containing protein [Aurantimonas sp. 22II-16-19i]
MTHRITRIVGNRRIAPIVDGIDFADDAEDDTPDYRSAFPPSAWLIDAANAGEIAKLRSVVADRKRHAIVIARAPAEWREATSNLTRLLLGSREELRVVRRDGSPELLDSVLAFLGHCHVVLTAKPDDEIPEVYKRLALVEIDAGRITAEHVDALIRDRWPGSGARWSADRDVVSIPSHHLSTAFYQAATPGEIVEILDVIRRHDVAEKSPAKGEGEEKSDLDRASENYWTEQPKKEKQKPEPEPAKRVVDEKMKRAIAQIEVQRPASPVLDDLAGYGAAASWASDLALDIAAFRVGEIGWQDVDQGCLLVGPPGTGKTLFARAAAATTGLPLIATSYAQWQSAGTGHMGDVVRSIRTIFAAAEQNAPCILFIDEIDAIRGRGTDERDDGWWTAIVTCLLECLDGISRIEGIVTIGACNHADKLDPALVRSGRLDRRFEISLPDEPALLRILAHHAPDVSPTDLEPIATALAGTISGADVARMTREAKRAARRGKRAMTGSDVMAAALPAETRSREIVWRTAVHEAGHVVAFLVGGHVPDALSLVSGGGMSGHVRGLGSRDGEGRLGDLEARVLPMLAGRAAEDAILGEPSAGAFADLEHASTILGRVESAFGLGGYLTPGGHDRVSVEGRIRRIYGDALMLVVRHRGSIVELARLAVERRVLSRSVLEQFGRERGII